MNTLPNTSVKERKPIDYTSFQDPIIFIRDLMTANDMIFSKVSRIKSPKRCAPPGDYFMRAEISTPECISSRTLELLLRYQRPNANYMLLERKIPYGFLEYLQGDRKISKDLKDFSELDLNTLTLDDFGRRYAPSINPVLLFRLFNDLPFRSSFEGFLSLLPSSHLWASDEDIEGNRVYMPYAEDISGNLMEKTFALEYKGQCLKPQGLGRFDYSSYVKQIFEMYLGSPLKEPAQQTRLEESNLPLSITEKQEEFFYDKSLTSCQEEREFMEKINKKESNGYDKAADCLTRPFPLYYFYYFSLAWKEYKKKKIMDQRNRREVAYVGDCMRNVVEQRKERALGNRSEKDPFRYLHSFMDAFRPLCTDNVIFIENEVYSPQRGSINLDNAGNRLTYFIAQGNESRELGIYLTGVGAKLDISTLKDFNNYIDGFHELKFNKRAKNELFVSLTEEKGSDCTAELNLTIVPKGSSFTIGGTDGIEGIQPDNYHQGLDYLIQRFLFGESAIENQQTLGFEAIADSALEILVSGNEGKVLAEKVREAKLRMRRSWISIPHLNLGAIKIPNPRMAAIER